MAKTAFLFPGQGSQYAGMGKTLSESSAAARAVFETADEALQRRPADPAPGVAPALREGQRHELELDVDAVERARDRASPGRARGRESNELVRTCRGLDEAGERAADVIADTRQRMRERADVVDDPHGRL